MCIKYTKCIELFKILCYCQYISYFSYSYGEVKIKVYKEEYK